MTKLRARSFLALPLIGYIYLCLSAYGFAEDHHHESELKQLKKNIFALEKKLHAQRKEKGEVQTQIEIIEIDSHQLSQNIRSLQDEITSASQKLKKLTAEKNTLEMRIANQRQAIAQHIRSAYKTGSEEPLKLFLNQQDPQKLARTLKYYDYLLKARSQKVSQFTADINQLDITAANIKTTKKDLANSKKLLEVDRNKLADKVKKREKILATLNKSLVADNSKLAEYQKQRKQLENLIKSVKQAAKKIAPAKDYPSFISRKGKLKWPLKGKLSKRFGTPRGGDLFWEGWLISAQEGTAIKSIHQGRVVFSNYLRGFGLLVIIDHGAGYMSLYAHNKELISATGDWIQSGEIIARTGNTGGIVDTALYFEIRENGMPVNPKTWLSKR